MNAKEVRVYLKDKEDSHDFDERDVSAFLSEAFKQDNIQSSIHAWDQMCEDVLANKALLPSIAHAGEKVRADCHLCHRAGGRGENSCHYCPMVGKWWTKDGYCRSCYDDESIFQAFEDLDEVYDKTFFAYCMVENMEEVLKELEV